MEVDWDQARQIIQTFLDTRHYSIRQLAEEAQIQASQLSRFLTEKTLLEAGTVVKLYSVLGHRVSPVDRRTFLRSTGLLAFAIAVKADIALESDPQGSLGETNPMSSGMRMLEVGEETAKHNWEQALPLFRAAEQLLGPASTLAARAACRTAQLLINFGDYEGSDKELDRIQGLYALVMDPQTRADTLRMRGWSYYYQGDFVQSERWLKECLSIAQHYEGVHAARIGESADHFLGRVYCAMGQTSINRRQADRFFFAAQQQFERSIQTHTRWGSEGQVAFDLVRKAQLHLAESEPSEALELMDRARMMFGKDLAVLHIDLEEARQEVKEGEIRSPQHKAERALRGWAEIGYAKGMADSLQILGEVQQTQGKLEEALEMFTAALVFYPFEKWLANRRLLVNIEDTRWDLIRQLGQQGYRRLLARISDAAQTRRDRFAYLGSVHALRDSDIARILRRLDITSQS